jgi:hypothetical protein
MSGLTNAVNAVISGCIDPLHPNYYATEVTEIQLKVIWNVNKTFWRSWDIGILELDCPGYPTQAYFRFYEGTLAIAGRDPILSVGGYVALCSQPGLFLGTNSWLWMAVLNYQPFAAPPLPIRQVHFQYKNSNAGSVGMVTYPLNPIPKPDGI